MYPDTCCVNRPLGDQSHGRVRLETAAMVEILERVRRRRLEWIASSVLLLELGQRPDAERAESLTRPCGRRPAGWSAWRSARISAG